MALSAQEKAAGTAFRDQMQAQLDAINTDDPPRYVVPHFLALFRHACAKRGHRSTALALAEVYHHSPAYPDLGVPAGRFGFLYRDGVCRGCRQRARSASGRLCSGWDRPPIQGRGARS